ncbi:uncharacterized protein LOC134669129 [Cydia fagiglandana]|uniref:uncharacterized protein LOC134669129 n=1 Tax=Cydia fagiglandana TaxID=1458189 RepID=UPI002FEE0D74
MVQRTVYSRISVRLAEEKQLLAEEKWIINALSKVRKERNRLQIDRLELENQKMQLMKRSRSQATPARPESPSEKVMKLMSSASTSASIPELEDLAHEISKEALCNEQELNLTVTNPLLSLDYNMVEEEVDSEGSDDADKVLLDMNMFMNGDPYGKPGKNK